MQCIHQVVTKKTRPIKIIQFGEGHFLRAFADYMVDIANETGTFNGSVALVKPRPHGDVSRLQAQECVYTVILRGKQNGNTVVEKRIITCVDHIVHPYEQYESYAALATLPDVRFVISNTTEAGLVYDDTDTLALTPPNSFPGKLTKLLYERFVAFHGATDKGLIMLPVELVENNGATLRDCVLTLANRWGLPPDFTTWVTQSCVFCNSLVDRIVTGYPTKDAEALQHEWGYRDDFMVAGEPFALWVIESEALDTIKAEFSLDKAGLPVQFTDNLQPYRACKVRILNGAHTATVLAAYLAGLATVGDLMHDSTLRAYLQRVVYDEIAPTVPLPTETVRQFANSVMERFENPFIQHQLLSIALNSVSKFRVRLLPSLKDCHAANGQLSKPLCFSFAALLAFYSGEARDGKLVGTRGSDTYEILDDMSVITCFAENSKRPPVQLVETVASRADFWGEDLRLQNGFCDLVAEYLADIRQHGMRVALEAMLKQGQ